MSESRYPDWVSRLARLLGPAQQLVTLVVLISSIVGYFVHDTYGKNHAAIAISTKTLRYTTSSMHDTRSNARKEALAKCREGLESEHMDDCKIATWFYNMCGALAMDLGTDKPNNKDMAWGADWAATQKVAEKEAMENCEKHSKHGKCAIVTSFCSAGESS